MCAHYPPTRKMFVALFMLAGGAALGPAFAQQPKASPQAPAAPQTGFIVKLSYSQKAMDTLVSSKETVIVIGYIEGSAKPGTPKQYVNHMGQVDNLGQVTQEVAPGAAATFNNVKPDPSLVKWVDSKGVQLLINVVSGRKSSPNNLLDCGIYDGPLQAVLGTTIHIACKLIGE